LSYVELAKQLTDLKKECVWMKEVSNQALQQSLIDLDTAFTNFFKKHGAYPNFKKKSGKQSFRQPNEIYTDFEGGRVYIPKFKDGIKTSFDREFTGQIRRATISKTPTNKYYISILVDNGIELPEKKPIKQQTAIGIDLGITSLITTSEGLKVENLKFLKKDLSHLKYLQRQTSRKMKGSKNRKKANFKIAKCHERITNLRNDFLHHVSKMLVNNHDTICVETLNVKGMIQNHKLAQAISDVSWGEFIRQVKYKAEWAGKNVLEIGTFEPSSKLCSVCGNTQKLELSDRQWTCLNCGTFHDRDVNAAINIKAIALKDLSGGYHRKKSVKLPTLAGALKRKNKSICGASPK
jgi:putative transposase